MISDMGFDLESVSKQAVEMTDCVYLRRES